jgi:hypothetical protein
MSLWEYRATVYATDPDLTGFRVEASDGHIGRVDETSNDAGRSFLVVDTGFWIFGKKRLIPAGVVERVDPDAETVHVGLTKDQVKSAPDYDEVQRATGDEYERHYQAN